MTPLIDTHLRVAGARLRVAAALVSAVALFGAGPASGAENSAEARVFHLPTEPLEGALIRFAVQAGVSVGGMPTRGCGG